jgi:hypothetical protein
MYVPTVPSANAGAPQVINVGGTLVASFMTNKDTSVHGWLNSSGVKVATSTNGGASWARKTV